MTEIVAVVATAETWYRWFNQNGYRAAEPGRALDDRGNVYYHVWTAERALGVEWTAVITLYPAPPGAWLIQRGIEMRMRK